MTAYVTAGTGLLVALQALLMGVDELVYHRRRGLSRLEAVGHPLDSVIFLAAVALPAYADATPKSLAAYAALAVAACVVITKDEGLHARDCAAGEHWIHALLFVVHGPILIGLGTLWVQAPATLLLDVMPPLVAGVALLQAVYWTVHHARHRHVPPPSPVNNAFYDDLGDRWYDDDTHAIALLRAEARLKVAYVREVLHRAGVPAGGSVLDVACGAGFIGLPLAADGYDVTGIDLSESSLAAARRRVPAGSRLTLRREDAMTLSARTASFDAVLVLDFLEHVTQPERALAEAARVLRPGGALVFHTFNRTLPARLLAIKALEIFTRDCPSHLHAYELFIKPAELAAMADRQGLRVRDMRGLRPAVLSRPFFWSVARRRVHPEFRFRLSRSLAVGYLGWALKAEPVAATRQ